MVCDRHLLWIEAVETVLARAAIEVIGRATATDGALAAVRSQRPTLLVTDSVVESEGEADGVALIERARADLPELRAIVVSDSDRWSTIERAFVAGASAYVMKSAHPDDLASAARQAFDHSLFLAGTPRVVAPDSERASDATTRADLTRREEEILRLVAEGHSNAQLGQMLWVTEQTVKFHLSNVYRKLGVSNRTEAARWAQVNGLLDARNLYAA